MDEHQPKKKRRLRPSATVRQEALKTKAVDVDKVSWRRRAFRSIAQKFSFIFRPVRWLVRHTVPRYIRGSFSELKQVTWPDRKQSRQLTTAVVMFATVFGVVVALLDYGLDKVFKKVFLHE
jgi:preprotein translocase SecE subunit